METNNNQGQQMSGQPGTVDYAAALRQYSRYGRGRSMKKFCEDEGYDYWKFCKLAREGQLEMGAKSGMSGTDIKSGFIEISPDGTRSPVAAEEPMKVCEIRILYTGRVDMRKGIDGLCGIIREEMGHNPRRIPNVSAAKFAGRTSLC